MFSSATAESGERLEYLGDSVLSLVVRDHMMLVFPRANEHMMTMWVVEGAHMMTTWGGGGLGPSHQRHLPTACLSYPACLPACSTLPACLLLTVTCPALLQHRGAVDERRHAG